LTVENFSVLFDISQGHSTGRSLQTYVGFRQWLM